MEKMLIKLEHHFPVDEHSVTAALLHPRIQNLVVVDDYLKANQMTHGEFLSGQVEKPVKSKDVQNQNAAREDNSGNALAILAKRHSSFSSDRDSQLASECPILYGPKSSELTDISGYWFAMKTQLPILACLAKKVF